MNALWTGRSLLEAVNGRSVGGEVGDINGVSIDSRTIGDGDVFFAIRGDRFDGHDFVAQCFERGAAVAVVAEREMHRFDPPPGPLVVVADVLAALTALGAASRDRTAARIVGVTGSVGKTSTKEALRLALGKAGRTHASVASFNNHWGVPLSLARMPQDTEYGVFEMGMNAAGEIAALTLLVRPQVAIITTVAPVHLAFFNSVEEIADAKAEIFESMEPGGTAILNLDNEHFDRLAAKAQARGLNVVSFGEREGAAARVRRYKLHADCSCVVADILGTEVTYKLGVPGRHLILNSLAVLAAVKIAGADLALAALALGELAPPAGRGARFQLKLPRGSATLIDESYNANPVSMRAAIEMLGQADTGFRGRRIAVLGDMLELGEEGPGMHRELANDLRRCEIDLVYASGPLMNELWQAVPHARRGRYAAGSDALLPHLVAELRDGDVVMVKGSLGSRMGPIVKELRQRFPDDAAGAA
ncbi:UDP-N-acetylmuramoylalanyl-D-glutamyl-2,6-diaminopimelate--D-alanyl-D-alanine ligase [Lutibaculum baratangense]|uniref:UDP-N-acetylmuramoyl-tripeptide--D-alanyl-D-alanine ligase n=1 Tax=Lutibaculum baratangense AMV1 TaxID=631454 RepID=V4RWE7_9HYPH|nr:UDP-N-acetylmuramoylalanyl-D-glutamyl-2,6-diaminopimelate--D-alanyl-D-alanine ligase [Lutibaculum baratangense]ESR27335.1 UDP-N-acetylmuramoylalanyl-D-glutamyl-2,6- diaminopimelate--D-alanyl-D-alanine ligase [Lutibaculum baratangense AMV1]